MSIAILGFWHAIDAVWRDLRYAVRVLRRSPAFTITAVATLALALGANTAVFGLVHHVLIASLPVDAPDRLFSLMRHQREGPDAPTFPYLFCRDLQQPDALRAGALCRGGTERLTIEGPGGAEPALGELVSVSYFDVLGVRPHLGRLFTAADERGAGAQRVVVLSHRYWQRRFGGDPSIVGGFMRMNAQSVMVIGVTPPEFDGLDPGQTADVRIPVTMQAEVRRTPSTLDRRYMFEMNIVVRLQPGVSAASTEQALHARLTRYLEETPLPPALRANAATMRVTLRPAAGGFGVTRQQYGRTLIALMGVTVTLLLIACANLAGLMASRLATRRQELATRLALGASRARILQQVLAEGVVLATAGSMCGVGVAIVCTQTLSLLANSSSAVRLRPQIGAADLWFHLAAAILTALLCAGGPAIAAGRRSLAPDLVRSGVGRRRGVRPWLIGVQTALSVSVLIVAGLFVRTVQALTHVDVGFIVDNVFVVSLDPKNAGRADAEVAPFYRAVRERVAALPGVRGVTYSTVRTLANASWSDPVVVEGQPVSSTMTAARDAVGPAYFQTLGIPLIAGRDFSEVDTAAAPRVAVVSESFARAHFGSQSALGRRIGAVAPLHTIVGVVRDSRVAGVRDSPTAIWYIPYEQRPGLKHLNLYVRTADHPSRTMNAVRAAIQSVDPRVSLFEPRTQTEQLEVLLGPERMVATLSGAFGSIAAALAAIGLYGLLAFTIAERRRELALRRALGASSALIVRTVIRDAAVVVGAGLLAGLVASLLVGRWTGSMLYGVTTFDPVTLASAVAVMLAGAAAAATAPVWRAIRVDPAIVLRE
jgi:predicted permease